MEYHNPRLKIEIKNSLLALLYNKPQDDLEERQNNIIRRNCHILGIPHEILTYKGEYFTLGRRPPGIKTPRLIPELYSVMDEYLKDRETLKTEMYKVSSSITVILNQSNNPLDFLEVFPESMCERIKGLSSFTKASELPRMKKEDLDHLIEATKESILLMKTRMVINLITG